jgi:hypothetical protein
MFRTLLFGPCFAVAASFLLAGSSLGQASSPFDNTIDTIPPGWSGPVFVLSKDYPKALPPDPKPWKVFDFKTQQKEYLQSVLAYALEGNDTVQWRVQDNAVRKWYHAPGLLAPGTATIPASGREFIHGLTRERTSPTRPKPDLHPNQTKRISNWAVGFYNPIAAFTVGKVWADPAAPNTAAIKFDDGAVAFKLLFTSATDTQVPFLANSMKWQANIDLEDLVPPSMVRQPRDVLLLQVDVAVRDDRADDTTGWVFGTFMYQNDAPGAGQLQRLVPVGLMWGNDPGLTKVKYDMGDRPVQTWLNKAGMPATKSPHLGWLDRLNGPVDNPRSSCLSCHARAVVPFAPGNTVPTFADDPDDPAKKFFTNTKAGEVYESAPLGSKSLDYSLQLAVGVHLFPHSAQLHPGAAKSIATVNPRAGESDEVVEATPATVPMPAGPGAAISNWWLWGGVGAGGVLIGLLLLFLWSRQK